jgi:hypothetical protein
LWAMSTLGFDKYVEPLKLYLAKYREVRASSRRLNHATRPVSTCTCSYESSIASACVCALVMR